MSEEWRIIAEFPDYAVSDHGRVKRVVPTQRGKVGNILKPHLDRYASLTLYRKAIPSVVLVHRLVCAAFHGAPPCQYYHAAHCDGNGLNNRADNLRWATPVENAADKYAHGTVLTGDRSPSRTRPEKRPRGASHGRHTMPERTARGERNGIAKLTEAKVNMIRADTRPRKEVAAGFGVSVTMVGFIQRGLSWAHVPMPTTIGEHA